MIDDNSLNNFNEKITDELDNKCEECEKQDETVSQNLILTGFKICKSCKISKTIFPIQLILLIGKAFILLSKNETERKAIIKKDKNTIPNDLKLDFKFSTCLVDIVKEAKIQN